MLNLVLVEDNPDESSFVRRAISRHSVKCRITEFSTLKDATDFFNSSCAVDTDLVLLDLKVKRKSGIELLRLLKDKPLLRSVPVIALSNSSALKDQESSWEAGCDGYFCKPSSPEGYYSVLKAIFDYWFSPENLSRRYVMQRKVYQELEEKI